MLGHRDFDIFLVFHDFSLIILLVHKVLQHWPRKTEISRNTVRKEGKSYWSVLESKIKHRDTIQPNFLSYVHYTLHESIRGYSLPKTQPWGLVDRSMPNFKILFLLIFCFAAVLWSRKMQKYGVVCKKAAMLKSIFQCPIRLGFLLVHIFSLWTVYDTFIGLPWLILRKKERRRKNPPIACGIGIHKRSWRE